jgi:hypothetical protein
VSPLVFLRAEALSFCAKRGASRLVPTARVAITHAKISELDAASGSRLNLNYFARGEILRTNGLPPNIRLMGLVTKTLSASVTNVWF